MRIGRNEIIEELTAHMRKIGGEPGEWCVGAARESGIRGQGTGDRERQSEVRGPMSEGGRTPANMPGLAYREAHTPYAAADAVDYLVSAFALHPARDLTAQPGKIVFVYRPSKDSSESEEQSIVNSQQQQVVSH